MDLDIYSTYKIFLRNIYFAKITTVFQQSIISYINKLEYLARSYNTNCIFKATIHALY